RAVHGSGEGLPQRLAVRDEQAERTRPVEARQAEGAWCGRGALVEALRRQHLDQVETKRAQSRAPLFDELRLVHEITCTCTCTCGQRWWSRSASDLPRDVVHDAFGDLPEPLRELCIFGDAAGPRHVAIGEVLTILRS